MVRRRSSAPRQWAPGYQFRHHNLGVEPAAGEDMHSCGEGHGGGATHQIGRDTGSVSRNRTTVAAGAASGTNHEPSPAASAAARRVSSAGKRGAELRRSPQKQFQPPPAHREAGLLRPRQSAHVARHPRRFQQDLTAPLITAGWAVKSGALATKPSTLTTRANRSTTAGGRSGSGDRIDRALARTGVGWCRCQRHGPQFRWPKVRPCGWAVARRCTRRSR